MNLIRVALLIIDYDVLILLFFCSVVRLVQLFANRLIVVYLFKLLFEYPITLTGYELSL